MAYLCGSGTGDKNSMCRILAVMLLHCPRPEIVEAFKAHAAGNLFWRQRQIEPGSDTRRQLPRHLRTNGICLALSRLVTSATSAVMAWHRFAADFPDK